MIRFSELIERNIVTSKRGKIFTKFKIKHRRVTLFFEEIGSKYIEECEKNGYSDITLKIAKKWMSLYFNTLIPSSLKKLPSRLFFKFFKTLWSVGKLIEDFQIIEEKNKVKIIVKGEGTTRDIGKNNFMVGFHTGVLSMFYKKEVIPTKINQTKTISEYEFLITSIPYYKVEGKSKTEYNKLNTPGTEEEGGIKDALKLGLFNLTGNKIYFRGKTIVPIETTLYHIIGNENLMIDRVAFISKEYFTPIIENETRRESKLILLKNLLQSMGWGIIKIIDKGKTIVFEIKNPPYGLQKEKDNWNFLIHVILGYLWLIDKNFRIKKTEDFYKLLRVTYSI